MIQAPNEFFRFCLGMHQDALEVYGPEIDDLIHGALGLVPNDGHVVLAKFLRELLAGNSDAEIMALFRSSDAEFGFGDPRELRLFLLMVAETIERQER